MKDLIKTTPGHACKVVEKLGAEWKREFGYSTEIAFLDGKIIALYEPGECFRILAGYKDENTDGIIA